MLRTGTDNINFFVNPNDKPCDTITDQEEQDFLTVPGIEDLFENLEELLKEIDDWDETKDDLPINPGSLDTLLLSNENMLMKLAPGKGRKPLYLTQDKFVEELAYPCVFAGLNRDLPEDLSILKKSKSDILRFVIFINLFSTSYYYLFSTSYYYLFSTSSYYCNSSKNRLVRTLFRSLSKLLKYLMTRLIRIFAKA